SVGFLLGAPGPFDRVALVSRFLLITVPTAMAIAAAVVCFETIGVLRGSIGTVVYFTLALAAIIASVPPDSPLDLTGIIVLRDSMSSSLAAQSPSFQTPIQSFAYQSGASGLQPFVWGGFSFSLELLATRVPVFLVTAGFLGVAGIAFDRFADPGDLFSLGGRFGSDTGSDTDTTAEPVEEVSADTAVSRRALATADRDGVPVGRVLRTELRMALRGQPRWWSLSYVAAVAATAVAPLGLTRSILLPTALLLPLSIWSELGAREHRYRTIELVFVNSNPVQLLLLSYTAGVAVGLPLVGPTLARFAVAGQWGAFLGGAAAVVFLPSAALAAGIWTGREGVFEIGYLITWYLGPMNGVIPFDYTAAVAATSRAGVPLLYLLLAGLGLGAAAVGRRRQVRLP
ncbi:MAG: hypothetical protein V5A56_06975, partial [Halolamina sp.]